MNQAPWRSRQACCSQTPRAPSKLVPSAIRQWETHMQVWEIQNSYGLDHLTLAEKSEPKPRAGEIVVAMKAASLNYRDLLTVKGFAGAFPLPLVPFSDGAGDV